MKFSVAALVCVIAAAGCDKEYDYDGDGPPVARILSPSAGDSVCPTVQAEIGVAGGETGVTFRCRIDDAPFTGCSAPVTTFDDLDDGEHTLTVIASNDAGDSEPVTVTFDVDGTGPVATATATAGAADSGTATLAIDVDEEVTVEAGQLLVVGAAGATERVPSCTCDGTSCACTGLAAGQNRLGATVTDACGNAVDVTADVLATYGPYRGHAVVLGHDYTDDATPNIVGNAAALAPFTGRDTARVVAFRPPGVTDATVANVTAAIDERVDADHVEVADPAQLLDYLRGRDVVILHEPNDAYTGETLDAIADDWADALREFADHGGIVVALSSNTGWAYLSGGDDPLIAVDGGSGVGGLLGFGAPDYVMTRYPSDALGGEVGYALLDGVDDGYSTPGGSGCVYLTDPTATTLLEHVGGNCGDGCSYYLCDLLVDQVMPRFRIDVAPDYDVEPYPACVPDAIGLESTGSFTLTLTDGVAAPSGTFACSYAPQPGYLQQPGPVQPCTVTSQGDGTYSLSMPSEPRDGSFIDITLLSDDGVPLRSGRAPVEVDGYVFLAADFVASNSCSAGYGIREYQPPMDPECSATLPSYLAVSAVTCTLERETSPGVFTLLATRTGTGCGAVANPGGGFQGGDFATDWSSTITSTGASGLLRHTVTITDFHGNIDTRGNSWTLSSSGLCS